jgi:hypothetical protein
MQRLDELLTVLAGRGEIRGADRLLMTLDDELSGEPLVAVTEDERRGTTVTELRPVETPRRRRIPSPVIGLATFAVIVVAVGLLIWLLPGGEGEDTVASTTTQPTPTTAATSATTTTVAVTTTVAIPVIPNPTLDSVASLEPGTYTGIWGARPRFTITVVEPTEAIRGEARLPAVTYFGFKPAAETVWHHPRNPLADFFLVDYRVLLSYSGEYAEEIEPPEDPTDFLLGHPYLEAGEPTPVTIDGHIGVQIDAVVTGSPINRDFFYFGGHPNRRAEPPIPEGAGVRIIHVEVDGYPIWMITLATVEGFEQAVEWSEALVAGIDFD